MPTKKKSLLNSLTTTKKAIVASSNAPAVNASVSAPISARVKPRVVAKVRAHVVAKVKARKKLV